MGLFPFYFLFIAKVSFAGTVSSLACKSMLELAKFKLHQVTMQKYHDKRVCFILSFDEHSTK